MSAYNAESIQDAFGKMDDLQYRMVKDDEDEEKNLIPKNSSNSSSTLLESWLRKCSLRSRAHSSASISCHRLYNLIDASR